MSISAVPSLDRERVAVSERHGSVVLVGQSLMGLQSRLVREHSWTDDALERHSLIVDVAEELTLTPTPQSHSDHDEERGWELQLVHESPARRSLALGAQSMGI